MVTSGFDRALRTGATYATLCVLAAFCVFPFLWMLDTALKPAGEVRSVNPTFWIATPTLENFRHVISDANFLVYFRNSVIVAGGSTLLALTVSIFCGYALSRFPRQPLSRAVGGALLLSQMIPGVLLLAPLYILMRNLGLLSTFRALILVYCTFSIPPLLCGGYNVYPRNIEDAIYEHPSVAECCVIGVPDAYRGQSPKAFVALKPGSVAITLNEMKSFLKSRLGKHEMISELEVRDALPRTLVGKLSKKELIDEEARKRAQAG